MSQSLNKPNILKFKPLKEGDTIGVIALSSPIEASRLAAGVRALETRGFHVKIALNPSKNYGKSEALFASASSEERLSALHELFSDPNICAIVGARGGYGCHELLPGLDFELFRRNPKPLIGFSDVCVLLFALYAKAGLVTIHGPSIESFSRIDHDQNSLGSFIQLVDLITGVPRTPFGSYSLSKFSCEQSQAASPIVAPLYAGNLSIICSLLGTAWEPNFDQHILVLEEVGEKPYRVHRMLLHLKLAGKLDNLSGVILGNFDSCVHPKQLGPNIEQVLVDIFGEAKYPVLRGAPFGHTSLNFPVPLGIHARLSDCTLEFAESPVL